MSPKNQKHSPDYSTNPGEDFLQDYLVELEHQLKALWTEHINCVEKNGYDEKAKMLWDQYFRLYRNYRNNKNWRKVITNS